ncbi:MAG TPA: YIP1 family protein [candidate division Zixibacteria bacterium]|nr:YIP1 family protein [candidate division Zixibacteria bacterium]
MNHLVSVWAKPRKTIRDIIDNYPTKLFFPLAAIHGVVHSFHLVIRQGIAFDVEISDFDILLMNVVFGAMFGIGLFYLLSFLLIFFGRLLGGHATLRTARCVLAWAAVPYLPLFIVLIPLLFSMGNIFLHVPFRDVMQGVTGNTAAQYAAKVYFILRGVMVIWSCVIGVIGLSEALGVSIMKSVGVWVLTILCIIVPIIVVLIAATSL